MKITEVEIGKTYLIRFHDGLLTPVTILSTKTQENYGYLNGRYTYGAGKRTTHYRARNERTGRDIEVKSAAKLRVEVTRNANGKWVPATPVHEVISQ
jgi:hypothetical protein